MDSASSASKLPGISSEMHRKEFAHAVMERIELQSPTDEVDFDQPHIYSLTVMEPRPYTIDNSDVREAFSGTSAVDGFVSQRELYRPPTETVRDLLEELAWTAKVIQVRFSDHGDSELNRINIQLS